MAAEQPERLAELVALWWSEAERTEVLPLVVGLQRLLAPRPRVGGDGPIFEFRPGGSPVPFAAAPRVAGRSHSLTAHVTVPDGGADGVLLHQGNRHGGYALYLAEGRLHYTYNYLGLDRWTVAAPSPVPPGAHRLRVEVALVGQPDGHGGHGRPAEVRLYVDDEPVAFAELPWTVPNLFAIVGVSCGRAAYDSVDPARFAAPFPFTGELTVVRLDVSGALVIDEAAEFRRLMAQQ